MAQQMNKTDVINFFYFFSKYCFILDLDYVICHMVSRLTRFDHVSVIDWQLHKYNIGLLNSKARQLSWLEHLVYVQKILGSISSLVTFLYFNILLQFYLYIRRCFICWKIFLEQKTKTMNFLSWYYLLPQTCLLLYPPPLTIINKGLFIFWLAIILLFHKNNS